MRAILEKDKGRIRNGGRDQGGEKGGGGVGGGGVGD